MQPQKPSFIVRLLSRYDYPTKFIFISCLFLFSLIVSNYFFVRAQNAQINFAKKELIGAKYEANLRKLLEGIVKHQLLTANYSDDFITSHKDIEALQQQISSIFTNIKVFDAETQEELQTSAGDFQKRDKAYLRPSK